MNGVHDMGGMHGFGPVVREDDEPVFHEDWERRTRAMVVGLSKKRITNLDEFRYAIERIKPQQYLTFSYYERWFYGLFIVLMEKDLLSGDEIKEIKGLLSIGEDQDVLEALTQLKHAPKEPMEHARPAEPSPRFKPGDRVRTKQIHPKMHIRLPGYIKGKTGVVKEIQGAYTLPESNIYSSQPYKEPLYLVEFEASEVWGAPSPDGDKMFIDLWESYIEPAAV